MRDLGEVLRDGMVHEGRLLGVLADGPKTIPEIAAALGVPPREALLWVMALRRYGKVSELPKPATEEYYRYRRTEGGR